jgi:Flp pilus assembly pilin Flp
MAFANLWNFHRRLWRDRRGQDLIEYALITAFVAVTIGGIFPSELAPSITKLFTRVVVILDSAP